MTFASRQDAGQCLGQRLVEIGLEADLVVGLPRGGVIVAAEVARTLHRPLEVLIVRKIGHPLHREFAVGALAEADVVVLDQGSLGVNPIARKRVNDVIREEAERLREYQTKFNHGEHQFRGQSVLLVDDGIATGATTEAAVLSLLKQGATKIIIAVPVASTAAVRRLQRVADQVFALLADVDFDAVGRYYQSFSQTTDEEVLELLRAPHAAH